MAQFASIVALSDQAIGSAVSKSGGKHQKNRTPTPAHSSTSFLPCASTKTNAQVKILISLGTRNFPFASLSSLTALTSLKISDTTIAVLIPARLLSGDYDQYYFGAVVLHSANTHKRPLEGGECQGGVLGSASAAPNLSQGLGLSSHAGLGSASTFGVFK